MPEVLKVVLATGATFAGITMDQLIYTSLPHNHYWYETDMCGTVQSIVKRTYYMRYTEYERRLRNKYRRIRPTSKMKHCRYERLAVTSQLSRRNCYGIFINIV